MGHHYHVMIQLITTRLLLEDTKKGKCHVSGSLES